MLGHRVDLYLQDPEESIHGELRKQDISGVWIYNYTIGAVIFFPMLRVREMVDKGEAPR